MSSSERIIQVPVTLDSANRRKDKSVKLSFTTMYEVSTEDYLTMDSYHQSAGHLLFKENEFQEEEIPQEDVEVDTEKSQSVQIRDALWVLYKIKGGESSNKQAWNQFYRKQQQIYKARILEEVHKLEEING